MTKKFISYLLILFILFSTASCGYLLYPNRRGQQVSENAKLDVGVVVLDSVGLLFFLIPGIVSFAVDYNYGTLYLPANLEKAESAKVIYLGNNINDDDIVKALENELQVSIDKNSIVQVNNF